MLATNSGLTQLERAVLEFICSAYPSDRAALEAQLATAILQSRENTGCGFFTRFTVDRSSSPPLTGERLRNGPELRIDGMKYGMGFILWLKQGYADCLEGYANGDDDTTALNFEAVAFEITNAT